MGNGRGERETRDKEKWRRGDMETRRHGALPQKLTFGGKEFRV